MATKGYRLTAATGIHKGDREYQQDQLALLKHRLHNGCLLGVVADGMGGRSGGRKASDQVMLTARQLFDRYDPRQDDAVATLRQIVQEAHMVIRLTAIAAEEEPHSTLAAFIINPGGDCHWIHSGDSRIYHFHQERCLFRTVDHSYVQSLVDRGEIRPDEADSHPQSNVLLGCLGIDKEPPTSVHSIPKLQAGDVLLACSDGVWHYFKAEEIGSIVARMQAREAAEWLVDRARTRAHGGGDNLSLIVVKLEAQEVRPPAAS